MPTKPMKEGKGVRLKAHYTISGTKNHRTWRTQRYNKSGYLISRLRQLPSLHLPTMSVLNSFRPAPFFGSAEFSLIWNIKFLRFICWSLVLFCYKKKKIHALTHNIWLSIHLGVVCLWIRRLGRFGCASAGAFQNLLPFQMLGVEVLLLWSLNKHWCILLGALKLKW